MRAQGVAQGPKEPLLIEAKATIQKAMNSTNIAVKIPPTMIPASARPSPSSPV
jgi:hypothetical protein